jgi:uncharacterized protein YqjF (DUF2071 family)
MAVSGFLKAKWTNLIMLNYEVDQEILKPYLPAYTVLDLWEGKALVSMVGFLFEDTSVLGVKWPFHINFEEVNLRFYVRYFDGKEWKRGAVFVSEIVPRYMIALIANNLYREHYSAMPMRHSINAREDDTDYLYEWKLNGKWNKLGGLVSNTFKAISPDSPEEFIFEHYWGYNSWNKTVTMEYQVEHVSWQVAQVTNPVFEADVAALYGKEFVPFIEKKPFSAFFAKGSEIAVKMGSKIKNAPVPLK